MMKPVKPKGLFMDITMCICWIFVLVSNIIICIEGGTPSWISTFCAMSIVILDYVAKVLDHYV